MKKYLFAIYFIATATFAFAQNSAADSVKILLSEDAVAADAARASLEKAGEADNLLAALDTVKHKKIRDGILYSLGQMKCEKAYPVIRKIAFAQKDDCPAAVLALAAFKTRKCLDDLKKLKSDRCKTASSALFLLPPEGDCLVACEKIAQKWNSLSENEKVWSFYNMKLDSCAKKFAMQLADVSPRVTAAQAEVLAKFGGKECAEKIFALSKNMPDTQFLNAIADCSDCEEVIIANISEGRGLALRAAKIRNAASAEDSVLKLLADKTQTNLPVKDLFDCLQSIGSTKTVKTFLANMRANKTDCLQYYAKFFNEALKRIDENNLKESLAELDSIAQNSSNNVVKTTAAKISERAKKN